MSDDQPDLFSDLTGAEDTPADVDWRAVGVASNSDEPLQATVMVEGEPVTAQQVIRAGEVWVAPLGTSIDDELAWTRLGTAASYAMGVTDDLDAGERVVPVLPYPDGGDSRSSGWSGSDTSHERAQSDDADGTTSWRQQRVLQWLGVNRATGTTWRELATAMGWHHGQASGSLSNLHKAGLIARLAEERRGRCAVYVLPDHVNGRPVAAYGRKREPAVTLDRLAEVLDAHAPESNHDAYGDLPPRCSCPAPEGDYATHLLEVLTDG